MNNLHAAPRARTIKVNGLTLHYADWGNASAPPLILQHGGMDHCRSWDWVAQALCADYHVIAPDLRGHGDSDWSPDGYYNYESYASDLAQLIEQLELPSVILVAHSLGAAVALRCAGIFPEKIAKLVTIEGLGPNPDAVAAAAAMAVAERLRHWLAQRREAVARPARRYATIEAACTRMQTQNPRLSLEQAVHLTQYGVRAEAGGYCWKFDNLVRDISAVDITNQELFELWGGIDRPILMMGGAESWFSDPRKDGRLACFRDVRFIMYEQAGHWVHHDRFDAFMHDLLAFIAPI